MRRAARRDVWAGFRAAWPCVTQPRWASSVNVSTSALDKTSTTTQTHIHIHIRNSLAVPLVKYLQPANLPRRRNRHHRHTGAIHAAGHAWCSLASVCGLYPAHLLPVLLATCPVTAQPHPKEQLGDHHDHSPHADYRMACECHGRFSPVFVVVVAIGSH